MRVRTAQESVGFREHGLGPTCWCHPRPDTCEDCGDDIVWHKTALLLPDAQPRMTVYGYYS